MIAVAAASIAFAPYLAGALAPAWTGTSLSLLTAGIQVGLPATAALLINAATLPRRA
jgi:hypothetical protein